MVTLALCAGLAAAAWAAPAPAAWLNDSVPPWLSYAELVQLAQDAPPAATLEKLEQLLSTPAVSNEAARAGEIPRRPTVHGVGPVLRVALWNLERGYNLEQIEGTLTRPAELQMAPPVDTEKADTALRQAAQLAAADIILINEADLGIPRSGYRDVTAHLGLRLRMNYAFGTEFVEVDPLLLGLEQPRGDPESLGDWAARNVLNKDEYRGLHGNAVLSRYPVTRARLLRLPECYDWFGKEKSSIAKLEKRKRWTARRLFEERISREIRRGGRMALIVELAVPEAAGGSVTVVSTHLENRSRPACRQRQMDAILAAVKEVPHAVVIGGDMNTTGTDAAPTSIRREITRRATSFKFWLGLAVRYASPVSLPQIGFVPVNHFKNFLDPTAFHLPVFLPNREDGLFTKLQRFQFTDGGRFDFSGSAPRTLDGRASTLGNSNQRHFKGFRPTFAFERTFRGLVGRYKLDWFFVKPASDGSFQPHYPVTMNELNEAAGSRISDHAPLTVDLPFGRTP